MMNSTSPENKTERDPEKVNVPVWLSCRWVLAYVGHFGFLFNSMFRINMSLAIVCMVNSTEEGATSNSTDDECGSLPTGDDSVMGSYNWDKSIQGHIHSAAFYGYLVMQVPAGMLADRLGGRYVMAAGMFLTAVASILLPVAAEVHVGLVIFLRILVGLGSGVSYPAMNAIWGRWAPPLERSKLGTFTYSGAMIGNILTLSVSGVMCTSDLGWPLIFYVFGPLGVVWCFVWLYFVHNSPETHPRISKAELDYIISTRGVISEKKQVLRIPWRSIATSLPVWAIIIAQVCNNWGNYTLLTNLPTYMKEVLKFDIAANGFLSSLPYIVQLIAVLLAGQAIDLVRRKGWLNTTNARKAFQCSGFIGNVIFMVATGFVECSERYLAVMFLCIAVFFTYGSHVGYHVNHVDIAPRFAGLVYGIANTAATLTGIIAPIAISEMTPDGTRRQWQKVFFTCAGLYMFGCISYGLFGSGELQKWAVGGATVDDNTEGSHKTKDFENHAMSVSDEHMCREVQLSEKNADKPHTVFNTRF